MKKSVFILALFCISAIGFAFTFPPKDITVHKETASSFATVRDFILDAYPGGTSPSGTLINPDNLNFTITYAGTLHSGSVYRNPVTKVATLSEGGVIKSNGIIDEQIDGF